MCTPFFCWGLNLLPNFYKQECLVLSQLRIQTGKFQLRISLLLKVKMEWRMKNFHILGIHVNIRVLRKGRRVMKNQHIKGDCLKWGEEAWTVCKFKGRGDLARKRWVVFLTEGGGRLISQWTLCKQFSFLHNFLHNF